MSSRWTKSREISKGVQRNIEVGRRELRGHDRELVVEHPDPVIEMEVDPGNYQYYVSLKFKLFLY